MTIAKKTVAQAATKKLISNAKSPKKEAPKKTFSEDEDEDLDLDDDLDLDVDDIDFDDEDEDDDDF
ncbi:hypothetical protein AEM51_08480 [Bacteroidetes bacterium UKL13-3]|jgi:hypothetical protein|nr:hypothetical protein AEM51_08480 [Bacteroidetes bacterium UKL13-3]